MILCSEISHFSVIFYMRYAKWCMKMEFGLHQIIWDLKPPLATRNRSTYIYLLYYLYFIRYVTRYDSNEDGNNVFIKILNAHQFLCFVVFQYENREFRSKQPSDKYLQLMILTTKQVFYWFKSFSKLVQWFLRIHRHKHTIYRSCVCCCLQCWCILLQRHQ